MDDLIHDYVMKKREYLKAKSRIREEAGKIKEAELEELVASKVGSWVIWVAYEKAKIILNHALNRIYAHKS